MERFIYTQEQLNKIGEILNQVEVKGRSNHQFIELVFQILESGIKEKELEVGDE